MPQNTNLNASPYFDDFSESNNYQKVLFKPGLPIQARELTTLQSILQNQVEKFGKHFFKEGSVVIPGQIAYDSDFTAVMIDETHLGLPVNLYLTNLIGKTIKGEDSGVTAKVETFITNSTSELGNYTLYVKYQSSSETDFARQDFVDGENLIVLDEVQYGLSNIRANSTFATTTISNSTRTGSAAKIAEGVYFIRGFFVNVQPQTVILDQYTNKPSYRVGLLITEELVTASQTNSDLFDNARGFSNFAAPGADRFKISTTLIKKSIDDFDDENFVELLRVENGVLSKFVKDSNYNLIRDELARRTYDESGDYYVKPFTLSTRESLNDRQGNNGTYFENQKTKGGLIPSDDLLTLSVSPGKAYVRGYEVETINTTNIDLPKTRTTEKQSNESLSFTLGRQIELNNVYGQTPVGFGTTSMVHLYDQRTATPGTASGNKIGVARVYDLKLKNAEYKDATTKFEASLYDVQTFTYLNLNTTTIMDRPAFIEGQSSNSSGFLYEAMNDTNQMILYQVSGQFQVGEEIKVNGEVINRTIDKVHDHRFDDVHQIVGNSGVPFTADPILDIGKLLAPAGTQYTITAASGGVSTVTSANASFAVGIKTGDIVQYTKAGNSVPTYNRVTTVNTAAKNVVISPTTNVTDICDGTLPSGQITTNDFFNVSLEIKNDGDAYLFSDLTRQNVANVDLSSSSLVFRKSYAVTVSGGAFSEVLETDPNVTLEPFDEEDYSLAFDNGVIEPLSNQKLVVSGRTVSLSNVSTNGPAKLTVTWKKVNLRPKKKVFQRCSVSVITGSSKGGSGSGNTKLDDGLTYNALYGTRVQDRRISLGIPDVANVIGVFESSTNQDPALPKLNLVNLNSNILNAIRGETIIGQDSGASAAFVTTNGTNEVEFVYLNENVFNTNELVKFRESNISANISGVVPGDRDIKDNFEFDPAQRREYVGYSALVRTAGASAPSKRLKVVYNNYFIDGSDPGDFVVVNSYDADRYTYDLPFISGLSASDIIDFRPRVTAFTANNLSPFEFEARNFDPLTSSSTHIIAKDKSTNLSYDYYVGRIDKLYLTKEGIFSLQKGIPALTPKIPNTLDNALEIATIVLPPYIYYSDEVRTRLQTHKRYRMKDIAGIEKRLKNVEYYTALSLLESDTANMELRDPQTNLNRFKAGFFVDNFKSILGGDIKNSQFRASIDTVEGRLRPSHYTTSIDLLLGSEVVVGAATSSNPSADYRFVNDLGDTNVVRKGDVVCLDYDHEIYIINKFATRIENVNPFAVVNWIGQIELNPSTDTWIETRRSARTYDIEGSFSASMAITGADSNTGMSPIDWGSWETTWTGQSTTQGPAIESITRQTGSRSTSVRGQFTRGPGIPRGRGIPITTTTTIDSRTTTFRNQTTTTTRNQSREGIQFRVGERFDSTSLGDKVVSTDVIATMRSRNIEFITRRLKPNTRLYSFFDNIDMSKYTVPKLIEIEMTSGTFGTGEVVSGSLGSASIRFRLAQQNHKYGPYNVPTEVFKINPYSPADGLSATYSSTATTLNVDTASLELQSASGYFGYVVKGMKLVGQSSGAIATVKDVRLITDQAGVLIGSLFVPDPITPATPTFDTGTKTFTLTSSSTNETISGFTDSSAETNFTSQGTLQNVEESTLRMRNADVQRIPRSDSRSITESDTRLVADTTFSQRTTQQTRWVDPLAESFEVPDVNGVFLTKCDVFFRTKDTKSLPVTLQVRTLETGLPTQTILPFGESILDPDQVVLSNDGTLATTFEFPSPVYCEGGGEFALVLLSASNEYQVFISRMGEEDVTTVNKPDSEKIIVSQQPLLGSLFKSQNGATWDPSQFEDLKFTLYRAEFNAAQANVRFYNPDLDIGNRQIASLRRNPIDMVARNVVVGMAKSLSSNETTALQPGITIKQQNNKDFSSKLSKVLGAVGIGSDLVLSSVGAGFTNGSIVYTNVPLIAKTGSGSGAKASIHVNGGVAVAATVSIGGTGYAAGDVLTVNSTDTGGFGKNLLLTIPNNPGIITSFNTLIIDNIQGSPKVDSSSNLFYVGAGGSTLLTGATVKFTDTASDGLHFRVKHSNHGMYSGLDRVELFGIESDIKPEKITAAFDSASTDDIPVTSVGIFTGFENYPVDANNPGYVKIGQEIIKYTGVSTNNSSITGITRAIDDTKSGDYDPNDVIHKYELNGVSLRRINCQHSFESTDVGNYPVDIDHYWVRVGVSSRGTNRAAGSGTLPELYFNETKSAGSYESQHSIVGSQNVPRATQNIPYNSLRTNVSILQPEGTGASARVRTFTGNSPDGSDQPFVDQGFEPISLNSNNPFTSPRIVASKVNELSRLQDFPGRKSFTMEFTLTTEDSKVSPMIDLDRVNVITTMDRINDKISDYATDLRVNSLDADPSASIYVSKPVNLEKSADGLKVMFDAYRHATNDIRVLYRIFRPDTPAEYQLFELFPGYNNLDGDGVTIDVAKNDGLPDRRITGSNGLDDYREYEYNVRDLPPFTGFQIKIIMTGTNFAYVPKIRDLRAIASI